MAIILAGAMILFMGIAVQNVYAENELPEGYDIIEVVLDGGSSISCVQPGSQFNMHVAFFKEGAEVAAPDGAEYAWTNYGLMELAEGQENPPADFIVEPDAETNGQSAKVTFPQVPEGFENAVAFVNVKVTVDGKEITAYSGQIGLMAEFYEMIMPDIDPFMGEGAVTTDQKLGVIRHYVSEDGIAVEEPWPFSYAWRGDDTFDALDIVPGKQDEKGLYPLTITRLSTDAELDFELAIRYTDSQGNRETASMNYWLAEFTTDLTKCSTEIVKGDSFTVYDDNWAFIDDVDADPAKGVSEENIKIVSGELEQEFDPNDFEVTDVKKYMGYEEETGNDIWEDAAFPLTFDKKGIKDKNGFRTDGTSLYKFAVKAKDGSRWTGKTGTMYLFVNSKYSLYNLKDYFIGSVEFTKLNKYLKSWDKDPYERYVIPKAKASKSYQPTIMIGKDKLTPGKQVTVKYVNDKTKKEYSSFPTALGEYTVVITGKAPYFGSDKSTHLRIWAKNPLQVKGKTVKIKKKQIKKKAKVLGVSKVIKTVKKGQGKVTYKKLSGNKKIVVSKTGKVTVKKGLKKGTYKVKVSVKAAGNDKYNPITKKVTFTIKVKKK